MNETRLSTEPFITRTDDIQSQGDAISISRPLLSQEELDRYILTIPPLSQTIRNCMDALKENNLKQASQHAQKDPALCFYLRSQVNHSLILKHMVTDVPQMFSSLGVIRTKQLIAAYVVRLLCDNHWQFFECDNPFFEQLQMRFMEHWNKILRMEGINEDSDLSLAGILLPSALVVCDRLFGNSKEEVMLLQQFQNLECNDILRRILGISFFQLAEIIGLKWQLPEQVTNIILLSEGEEEIETADELNLKLARYLHLLLFYILSQPGNHDSNFLRFCFFNVEFTEPVRETFLHLTGVHHES